MKLFELLNVDFPHLEEEMSKQELNDKLKQHQKTRFQDAMLSALHRLVISKGDNASLGSYAFEIGRSF